MKTEEAFKNGQSIDTGNIEHMTRSEDKQNTTQKTKKITTPIPPTNRG